MSRFERANPHRAAPLWQEDKDHDWKPTGRGTKFDREYACTKCPAVEDRDVS